MRKEVNGTLYLDGKKVATGRAEGSPTFINALTELYLGGTPEGFDAKRVTVSSTHFLLLSVLVIERLGTINESII